MAEVPTSGNIQPTNEQPSSAEVIRSNELSGHMLTSGSEGDVKENDAAHDKQKKFKRGEGPGRFDRKLLPQLSMNTREKSNAEESSDFVFLEKFPDLKSRRQDDSQRTERLIANKTRLKQRAEYVKQGLTKTQISKLMKIYSEKQRLCDADDSNHLSFFAESPIPVYDVNRSQFCSTTSSATECQGSEIAFESEQNVTVRSCSTRNTVNPRMKESYEWDFQPTPVAHELYVSEEEWRQYSLVDYVTEVVEKKHGLHKKSGLVKLKMFDGYKARDSYEHIYTNKLKPKLQNVVTGMTGGEHAFTMYMDLNSEEMDVRRYMELADYICNAPQPNVNKEAYFWDRNRLTHFKSFYGTDVENADTLFENEKNNWSIGRLDSLVNLIELQFKDRITPEVLGITRSYIYYGTWGTYFPFHKENMNTYSANYHHLGGTKTWYTTNPSQRKEVDELLAKYYPDFSLCPYAYRHKKFLPSPALFCNNELDCIKVEQHPGEYVIAFCGEWHWGFNDSFNVSEAVNFGTDRWLKENPDTFAMDLCRNTKYPTKCRRPEDDLTWSQKLLRQAVNKKYGIVEELDVSLKKKTLGYRKK